MAEFIGNIVIAGHTYRVRQSGTPKDLRADDLPEAAEQLEKLGWVRTLMLDNGQGSAVYAAETTTGSFVFFDPEEF